MEIIYFLIASFLVVIVPGPTVSLIIANSLKSGMRAGILNVVGTQIGLIILILITTLTLTASVHAGSDGKLILEKNNDNHYHCQ